MFDKPSLEIPPQIREMAEKNVEQTRTTLSQFIAMAKQAQELMVTSPGAEMKPALDIQSKALRYAEQNIDAGFRLAADLAQARDVKEYTEIQTRYAQTQAFTFHQQANDLGRLVSEATEKAQSGKK